MVFAEAFQNSPELWTERESSLPKVAQQTMVQGAVCYSVDFPLSRDSASKHLICTL